MVEEPSESARSSGDETGLPQGRYRVLRSVLSLAVAAVALYALLPRLVSDASSWRSLANADWRFTVLALVLQVVSWVWVWQLDRITLNYDDWFVVSTTQLAGNALGRVIPGVATPTTASLLSDAGMDAGEAVAGLTASTALQIGTALALPVLVVPELIFGAPVDRDLMTALYMGLVALAVLSIVTALALWTDGLLTWVGRVIQGVLNKTVRRHHPISGLPDKLLQSRDFVRDRLRDRWRSALLAATLNTFFDYLCLLAVLRAVDAQPRPALVVLAYSGAKLLAQIPLTPGGLGFVEAGLTGMLTLAGVPGSDAFAATLMYRLLSYWLTIPVGGVAYLLFRRRYPSRSPADPADTG